MITVGETARHDALNALVPALAAHDNRAPTVIGLLDLCHGIARKLGFNLASLAIDFLELGGKRARFDGVVGKQ